jgi:hypothetical protein
MQRNCRLIHWSSSSKTFFTLEFRAVMRSHRIPGELAVPRTIHRTLVPIDLSEVSTCWRDLYPSHLLPHLPDDDRAVCASCSSGRGFACRFLQTPLHSGSPCDSANGSRHQGP